MVDPYTLIKKHLFDVKIYKAGKPIEELKRELAINDISKLASNENAFGPSSKVLCAMRKALKEIYRYPDSSGFSLRRKLADTFRVSMDHVILGNGSDDLILLTVRAFCNPGDEVIIADPTFMMYTIASMQENIKIKYVPLRDFYYDLPAMANTITNRTKLIFIANPNNPTGTYVTKKEVAQFMKKVPDSVIVFFDEAYIEYVKKRDFPNIFEYVFKRNIIISRTFSKIYGLAGLRIGYAIAKTAIVEILNRVRDPFNVNSLAQIAAESALEDSQHVRRTYLRNEAGKQYFYRELDTMGIGYVPTVTNFLLIDVATDPSVVFEQLLRKGIIVRDMKSWGLATHIRVTIGLSSENRKFIKALKEVLKK